MDNDSSSSSSSSSPPTGLYFFYGTLTSPALLGSILNLPSLPTLRPARISGWTCKYVGSYPALIPSEDENEIVEGAVYEVLTPAHAARLAAYETRNYEAVGCELVIADGEGEEGEGNTDKRVQGWVFEFVGNPKWLRDGPMDPKGRLTGGDGS